MEPSKEAIAAHLSSILERGLYYHQQGDLEHAEKNYRKILDAMTMNADALQKIKDNVSQNRLKETLFDILRLVRNIEDAYCRMWQIFLGGWGAEADRGG